MCVCFLSLGVSVFMSGSIFVLCLRVYNLLCVCMLKCVCVCVYARTWVGRCGYVCASVWVGVYVYVCKQMVFVCVFVCWWVYEQVYFRYMCFRASVFWCLCVVVFLFFHIYLLFMSLCIYLLNICLYVFFTHGSVCLHLCQSLSLSMWVFVLVCHSNGPIVCVGVSVSLNVPKFISINV